MARGRFLSKSIVDDTVLADVSLKAYALFLSAIPHLDVEGRMNGHPRQVKRIVIGLRDDYDVEDIGKLLRELHEAALVIWYEVDGKSYLYFPAFKEHQVNLRPEREARSTIPAPE